MRGKDLIVFLKYLLYKASFFPVRPMFRYIKKKYKQELIGVEIGVDTGLNAYNVLCQIPQIKKIYLVDPWGQYHQDGKTVNTTDAFYKCMKRLSKFRGKIVVIRKKSEVAADDIPNSLDFVYIDGNHQYEYVKKDTELYYPKVKEGGIIGGDDFYIRYPGVCKAVLEFAEKNDLNLQGGGYDWWIKK